MQEQDYEWFLQNTVEFYEQYGKKYLAIKNRNIIGIYETFKEALHKTMEKEALGTFIIQECLENPEKAVYHFQYNVRAAPARKELVG